MGWNRLLGKPRFREWMAKLANRFRRPTDTTAVLPNRAAPSARYGEDWSTVLEKKEQAIRKHAYAIWEEEGRPSDRELQHWLRAETEIRLIRVKSAETASSLDTMRKVVEDAASISSGLWLSYLFLLFYIAIAVSAVTHVDYCLKIL